MSLDPTLVHAVDPLVQQTSSQSSTVFGVQKVFVYAFVSALALILGAGLGVLWRPSRPLMGVLLAFAGGALVTAAAYELLEHAFQQSGAWLVGGWLLISTAVFAFADSQFKRLTPGPDEGGWSLLASVTLDGIPENLALGVVLAGSGGAGLALLAAFFFSNFPQALSGARGMRDDDYGTWTTFGGWCVVAVLIGVSVWVGKALIAGHGTAVLSSLRAIAGGAILASLADEIFPDAYESATSAAAVATGFGFLMTYVLK